MYGLKLLEGELEAAGFIPMMLDTENPKSAAEQLHDGYAHGGGWRPFKGFTREQNGTRNQWRLRYVGDQPMYSITAVQMRDEVIVVYEGSWVTVHNVNTPDEFVCARMD